MCFCHESLVYNHLLPIFSILFIFLSKFTFFQIINAFQNVNAFINFPVSIKAFHSSKEVWKHLISLVHFTSTVHLLPFIN